MNHPDVNRLSIQNEFSTLKQVIIGQGAPYLRDKEKVAAELQEFPLIPNTAWKEQVLALTYPTEEQLIGEYAAFIAVLEKHGVEVLLADTTAAYSFDYTCPRDIGFVIRDTFFIANMAVHSRADEIKTVLAHLKNIDPQKIIRPPAGAIIEGGDVIVLDAQTVLVGIHQRTNQKGFEFLRDFYAGKGVDIVPVYHSQLHLDCCLNPLGMGHMLIHPNSLAGNSDETWRVLKQADWIEVDDVEREHLATNLLSINRSTLIARQSFSSARVNGILTELGYTVEEVVFDGVPATGGSFRCASLVLCRVKGELDG